VRPFGWRLSLHRAVTALRRRNVRVPLDAALAAGEARKAEESD
jgi:hypothetical protein